MNYSIDILSEEFRKGKRHKFLFFWGHQKSKDGSITKTCFSQWWGSPFTVEGVVYKTAEHWMMAKKAELFNDAEIYDRIVAAKSPVEAKALGREVKGFKADVWTEKCYQIVVEGNFHKFSQNEELKEFLLQTKDRVIVEASPVDKIWGIGLTGDSDKAENPLLWNGLNLLGFALMEVRDQLVK
jgi:ribA/ribD-fused uncharacterized protein